MNQEQVWQEYANLPPTAQKMVAEFIEFLRQKYNTDSEIQKVNEQNQLASEPFIGMWSDHAGLANSTEFVRNMRLSEWNATGE